MPEVRALDDGETLTFLHGTISTRPHAIGVPETPMYLDGLLADTPLTGGLEPMLGEAHLRTLTILGFPNLIREWLKVLRKRNVAVLFATQSLADIADSAIAPAIIESCPQRILLPNDRAIEPQSAAAYERFGLNARQIELVSRAVPKRQYYLQSARGNRLFELGLGPLALALCGASDPEAQKRIDRLLADGGAADFAGAFLTSAGLPWAADLLARFPAARPTQGEEE